jgi:hypothetical protein
MDPQSDPTRRKQKQTKFWGGKKKKGSRTVKAKWDLVDFRQCQPSSKIGIGNVRIVVVKVVEGLVATVRAVPGCWRRRRRRQDLVVNVKHGGGKKQRRTTGSLTW